MSEFDLTKEMQVVEKSESTDTTYQRRARTVGAVSPPELQVLRVKTWFANVLSEAALDDDSGENLRSVLTGKTDHPRPKRLLQEKLNRQLGKVTETYFDTLSNLSRQFYDVGEQTPGDRALQAMEKLYPGTLATYEHGPLGEPLWLVVSGDRNACEEYLEQLFPEKVDQPFEEIVLELFKSLLSPKWFIRLDQVPASGQSMPHPIWSSYVHTILEEKLTVQKGAEKLKAEPEFLLEARTIDDLIIGTIAAWSLAIDQKEPIAIKLEWLQMGLCQGVIGQVFSPDIQDYVLALMKRRAQEIVSVLKWVKHPEPDFAKRWTTEFRFSTSNKDIAS